jgi:two-component system, OmpR family, copper resistance phosphate regulon response regulator CusR
VKPFAFAELLARLRAIIRRGVRPLLADRIELGPLALDCRGRTASLDGRDVALTEREYTLLEYLARHAGDVLGRAAIAEHVWDASYDPLSNVIDVYIQRLRRKLGAVGAALIETRRGEGYRLLKPRDATE